MKRKSLIVFVNLAVLVVCFAALPPLATAQDADTTYTMWFRIFNNPEACTGGGPGVCTDADLRNPAVMGSVLYATGQRVQSNGQASFAAALGKGCTLGTLFGPGLLDPTKAQIELHIRTHGPVLPDLLNGQITTLNGGCPPNQCRSVQGATHRPGDADGEGRSTSAVLRLSDGSVVPGASSTLLRSEKGIIAAVHTVLK